MAQQTRKDPRAKVLSMTVRYKSATLDEFIEHHSHDVSRGGMFIKTPQPFPPGTLLKFEVRIAEDRKVMQGVGRVVWKRDSTAADNERPAGMGVKFIKLDDDSRRLIDQLLSSRREELSAYDAEVSQPGIDTEAPVGLGTEPLSMPARSSKAPGGEEPSFFPKLEPAELPPPEDRTVMKQAAELLEEALREVDGPAPPPPPEEKEDTKPGRHSSSKPGERASKPGESVGRIPAPRMPPMKATEAKVPERSSESAPQSSRGAGASHSKAPPTVKGGAAASHGSEMDVAKGITERARAISKAPVAASAKPPAAGVPAKISAQPPAKVASVRAQPTPASAPKGSGRGTFWFLAVAACAAGTWWIWRPRPMPEPEQQVTTEQPSEPQNAAPAAAPEPTAAPEPVASAAPPADAPAASASAAPTDVASAVAAPATPPQVATPPAVPAAQPPPAPKVAAPAPVRKPKSTTTSAETPAENPTEPPATPPADTGAAPAKPAEPKATASSDEPAAKPAPTEAPAAPAPTPAPKKPKAPAVDSDNPY